MYFESLNTKKITDNRTWKTVVPLFTSMALRGEKIILKGYLRYKTRTSQNVSFEAQVKNFFIRRKVMFLSQDILVFVFLTIPRSAKYVTS